MKSLALCLVVSLVLGGCAAEDGVQQVAVEQDQGAGKKGKGTRAANDDAANDEDANDDDAEDPAADGASADAGSDADVDTDVPDDEDDAPTTPGEEDPEDTVVFGGGGGVEVVVEPEGGSALPDEPIAEPAPDEPAPDEPVEDPLVACDGVHGSGDGTLIDDMEDGDLESLWQDERAGTWFYYDDGSDGAHSLLMDSVEGGATGSTRAVHITGGGFSEWGSGAGVGLRWDDGSGDRCVYDASYYTGLRLWLRGNGAPVRIIAINPAVIPVSEGGNCGESDTCWDNHGVSLETTEEWTEVFVPFADLSQRWSEPLLSFDPTQIYTVEFTLDAGVDYDVWIDDLGFYREGEALPAYGESLVTDE